MKKAFKVAGILAVVFIGLAVAGLYFVTSRTYDHLGGMENPDFDMMGSSEMNSVGTKMAPSPTGMAPGYSAPSGRSQSMATPEMSIDSSMPTKDSSITDKKVIKNGDLSLKVDNVDESLQKISQIAKKNGGEIHSSNVNQSPRNIKSGYATVKVPVGNFEAAFSELKTVANLVVRESTSGTDVTEQYVDLEAQLKNRQAEEQAFTRILDKAVQIEEVLSVQREISRVRGQIEQIQGRMKYLESQTDQATITINLSEDAEIAVTDRWRPGQVAKAAINDLVRKVQNFVDFLIQLVITVIPVLLLYGLLVLVIYKIGKRIYRRLKKNAMENAPRA